MLFNIFKLYKLMHFFTLFEGEDDTGGASDDLNKGSDDRVSVLEQTVEGLVAIVKTVAESQGGLQQSLSSLSDAISGLKPADKTDDDDSMQFNDEDLETMSRKELIALINQNTEKAISKSLGTVTKNIDALGGKLDETISSYTVKEFEKDHKDLMEWKTEIRDILSSGRSNNVADAYTLARNLNVDKAKKLDEKYNPTPKKEGKDVVLGFRGFPPGGSTKGAQGNTRMTVAEAATAAWDDAVGQAPGIEQFLSNDTVINQ